MIINLRVTVDTEDLREFVGLETEQELAEWLAQHYFWESYRYFLDGGVQLDIEASLG